MIDGKYSVRDVLPILSMIKIYRTENGEITIKISKKVTDLVASMKIDLYLLRKK